MLIDYYYFWKLGRYQTPSPVESLDIRNPSFLSTFIFPPSVKAFHFSGLLSPENSDGSLFLIDLPPIVTLS